MRASDCPTVDTYRIPAGGARAGERGCRHHRQRPACKPFQRCGGIDLGRRPRRHSRPRSKLSRAYRPPAELRDHHPARRWQPASGIRIGLARRDRRPQQLHGLCSRHHRRGRTARADRASEPGGRQDHPRRRRHRSQPARRLYQRGVLRNVRILGRGSAGTAGQPVARRTVDRPQDPAPAAPPDLRRLRRRGGNSRLRQERRRDLGLGHGQGVPQRSRAHQIHIRPAERYQRKQAAEVAAATDHGRAGRRTPDHRDCRPALPARRSHRARRRLFGAAHRLRRIGPSTGWAQPARRILPRARWRRHRAGHRLVRISGVLRRGGAGGGHRQRPALAAVQGDAARGRPESLLVDADQGQGRPRDRHLCLLFQGMPRAEPLASADRRRLRSPRCAGDRAQGGPRPDRPARLPRHADRAAEPRAVARTGRPGDRRLPRASSSRCCSSISITSRTSTIRSDTRPATHC